MQQQPTTTATNCPAEDRRRRRRAALAWGSLAGVAALVTTAAFTDVARLNVGAQGLGGAASSYNIQVGATDAAGALVPGEWQEADDLAGVPLAFVNADRLAPGGDFAGTEFPVRNDSPTFSSTISVSVDALADDAGAGRVTDPDYLASLAFHVSMGGTAADPGFRHYGPLTFDQMQSLQMNELAPGEEAPIAISVKLLSQSESGASYDDRSLNGKGAHLQLRVDGASR